MTVAFRILFTESVYCWYQLRLYSLGIRVISGRDVKTVVADSVMYHAHVGRKVSRAGIAIRVEKEQRIVDTEQPAAGQRPIYNIVMNLRRSHIVDVLRVIYAADCFPHTHKLTCLNRNHEGKSADKQ